MNHFYLRQHLYSPHPCDQLSALGSRSYIEVHGAKNVVLDTVKCAEDSSHIILRLYEAYGGQARVRLQW
jgi:alpha-mannosidase